jgi:hypothetical protein
MVWDRMAAADGIDEDAQAYCSPCIDFHPKTSFTKEQLSMVTDKRYCIYVSIRFSGYLILTSRL